MERLALVRPSIALEAEFLDMTMDWKVAGEPEIPWYCVPPPDFPAMLSRLEGFSRGIGLPDGFLPNSTFWLVKSGRVLGAVNIRHALNDFFLSFGGQIGYGIRPSERRKGYATELLRLALPEAGMLGLKRALLCCYGDNTGSVKVIERNGGVLEDERTHEGRPLRRYWIDLESSRACP